MSQAAKRTIYFAGKKEGKDCFHTANFQAGAQMLRLEKWVAGVI